MRSISEETESWTVSRLFSVGGGFISALLIFQVCSALIHPFSSDTVPSDSDICLTFTSNQVQMFSLSNRSKNAPSSHFQLFFFSQTSKEVRGRIHVDKREMLHLFGQVHSDSWSPSQRELKVRCSFSHRFAVNSPPPPRRLTVFSAV